jgi:hypothetical protein
MNPQIFILQPLAEKEVLFVLPSFPRQRESSILMVFWSSAGVYPCEGWGGGDGLIMSFSDLLIGNQDNALFSRMQANSAVPSNASCRKPADSKKIFDSERPMDYIAN